MAEFLWAAGILMLLGFGYLMTRRRKTLAGDMDAPIDLERARARSEAEMAAVETQVLTKADAGQAAVLVAFHRDLATGEQPVVSSVRRRHLYRPPSQRQLAAIRARQLKPVQDFKADPLSAPLAGPLAPAVIAASVPVSPAPQTWFLESFTASWSREEMQQIVAEANASGMARLILTDPEGQP